MRYINPDYGNDIIIIVIVILSTSHTHVNHLLVTFTLQPVITCTHLRTSGVTFEVGNVYWCRLREGDEEPLFKGSQMVYNISHTILIMAEFMHYCCFVLLTAYMYVITYKSARLCYTS